MDVLSQGVQRERLAHISCLQGVVGYTASDVDRPSNILLLSGQALELDAAEILKEVMPKLPEPFSKYIDTIDEEELETIDIVPKEE